MLLRVPDYYDAFRCIAGDCRDSCCIGWEIGIDAKTLEDYRRVEGAFGERLRAHIADGCFILTEEERCPFLNGANLCDIYTTLGEAHLCQICTDHPRFFEWFGEIKEGGIGLCCEVAAQLILSRPLRLIEREIPEAPDVLDDPDSYAYLLASRAVMLRALSEDAPSGTVNGALLRYASYVQRELDGGTLSPPTWEAAPSVACDLGAVLAYLQTLEPMDPAWHPLLAQVNDALPLLPPPMPEDAALLRRIGAYFVYRYAMKAVFDGELLSRVRLGVLAMEVIGALWRYWRMQHGNCPLAQQADLAKAFSKEIEYSEENLDAVLDMLYDGDWFREI